MKITLLTIFPDSFQSFLSFPVIRRAVRNGLVEIEVVDIREHADGSFRAIDDSPYGGGRGLILRADTMVNALKSVESPTRTVLMGPKGRKFDQALAHDYARENHLVLISGHFEGVDERFRSYIDEEVSIGDYILTGGESAAQIIAEATIRLLDGVLREHSAEDESFEGDLLEYPQYTHPEIFEGMKVPGILLRGNRNEIEAYHEKEAISETIRLRPDLLAKDQDFRFFTLHKDYGNEAEAMEWLDHKLPLPEIVMKTDKYLLLSRTKGKTLSECSRTKILRTIASILKRMWSLDISTLKLEENTEKMLSRLKEGMLTYDEWEDIKALENMHFPEDRVFSHGSLTLESIMADGSGITGILNLQKAGISDRYRDLESVLSSLEKIGTGKEELLSLLGISIDEEKLEYYRRLRKLTER